MKKGWNVIDNSNLLQKNVFILYISKIFWKILKKFEYIVLVYNK